MIFSWLDKMWGILCIYIRLYVYATSYMSPVPSCWYQCAIPMTLLPLHTSSCFTSPVSSCLSVIHSRVLCCEINIYGNNMPLAFLFLASYQQMLRQRVALTATLHASSNGTSWMNMRMNGSIHNHTHVIVRGIVHVRHCDLFAMQVDCYTLPLPHVTHIEYG